MDDKKIIELYFNRDEQAIYETKNKYDSLCFSLAKNILSSHEDAEECVNDAYLSLWNQIPPLRPIHLRAYLCKIVRNLALKKAEYNYAEKRNPDLKVSFDELENVLSHQDVEESCALGEVIGAFLHMQKPQMRQVFVRRYFFFDSVKDIAIDYGMNENRVKSILFRLRNQLRTYLERSVIENEESYND